VKALMRRLTHTHSWVYHGLWSEIGKLAISSRKLRSMESSIWF